MFGPCRVVKSLSALSGTSGCHCDKTEPKSGIPENFITMATIEAWISLFVQTWTLWCCIMFCAGARLASYSEPLRNRPVVTSLPNSSAPRIRLTRTPERTRLPWWTSCIIQNCWIYVMPLKATTTWSWYFSTCTNRTLSISTLRSPRDFSSLLCIGLIDNVGVL